MFIRHDYMTAMGEFWSWLLAQEDVSADLYMRIRAQMPHVDNYDMAAAAGGDEGRGGPR